MAEQTLEELQKELKRLELVKRRNELKAQVDQKLNDLRFELAHPIRSKIKKVLINYGKQVLKNYGVGLTEAEKERYRRMILDQEAKDKGEALA